MARIEVTLGGKGIGLADQASIEPAKGCNNGCVGCYAAKTTRMGAKFSNMQLKEYDDDIFRRSCKAAYKKDIRFVRMAKHCDPGDPGLRETIIRILQTASEEGLRIVFVSKSLSFDTAVASAIKDGNHILHMSLGMKTDAVSDYERGVVALTYAVYGVDNTYLRLCYDVTKKIPVDIPSISSDICIVTPMRFPSKAIAELYDADLDKFEFTGGYYRPKEIHESWSIFTNWCGEVGDKVMCCNCLVGVENED